MHLLRLLSSPPLAAGSKNWSMSRERSLSVNIVFPFPSGSDSLDAAGGIAACEVWSSTNRWVFRLLIISGLTLWHRFGRFWCYRNCRRGGAASSSSNTGMGKIMLAFWGCCRCRCRCRCRRGGLMAVCITPGLAMWREFQIRIVQWICETGWWQSSPFGRWPLDFSGIRHLCLW